MAVENRYDFPRDGIHQQVVEYINNLPDLTSKVVLDIPCGDGRASYEFIKKGAEIVALDLFPDFMKLDNLQARYADLSKELPLEDESIDYIICQEGIEHIPNQLKVLQEFNRVLKQDGILLITTPNDSHVRARLSYFLLESDYWKRLPPTEIDGIWFAENASDKLYFGHLFLLGVHHFQSLLTFTGFTTKERVKSNLSSTSLVLGIILYPVFSLFTLLAYLFFRKKNTHINQQQKDQILWDRVKLNLSPTTLLYKHIFWILQKESNLNDTITRLKKMRRT